MPKLVFHSTNPEFVPSSMTPLIDKLKQLGLIGDSWEPKHQDETSQRYLIGDKFLSLITFMGCAPAVELEPSSSNPQSTDFCHFEVTAVTDETKFLFNSHTMVSRCPHCRHRHADWKKIPENLRYACDKCHIESHLSEFDWKNNAGCGRFFINLHGIYPQEAIPAPQVLDALEQASGERWHYFYTQ